MVNAGFKRLMPPQHSPKTIGTKERNRLLNNANLIEKSNDNAQIINAIMRLKQNRLLRFNKPGFASWRNVANALQKNFNNTVKNMNIDAAIAFKPSQLKLSTNLKMKAKKGAIMIKQVV